MFLSSFPYLPGSGLHGKLKLEVQGVLWTSAVSLAELRPQKHFWYILRPRKITGGDDCGSFSGDNMSIETIKRVSSHCIVCNATYWHNGGLRHSYVWQTRWGN